MINNITTRASPGYKYMYYEFSPFINYSTCIVTKTLFSVGSPSSTVSSRCASSKLVSSLNSAYMYDSYQMTVGITVEILFYSCLREFVFYDTKCKKEFFKCSKRGIYLVRI